MTREEAIKRLMRIKAETLYYAGKPRQVSKVTTNAMLNAQVFDMAIEALKDRTQGEWVKAVDDGVWSFTDAFAECDQCHKVTFNGWNMDYCPSCGASMRGEEE